MKPFSWFLEEVANARGKKNKDLLKKQLGDVAKLKGNSFYGKMIEDWVRHRSTKSTRDKWVINKTLRSPFFDESEEISGANEVKKFKQNLMIKRPYQGGITVHQLTKLQMIEFFYDIPDKYLSRQDFELCYMDTHSFYLAMRGDSLDEIAKIGLRQAYETDKKNWLATDKFSERTSSLFEPEFIGTRGV